MKRLLTAFLLGSVLLLTGCGEKGDRAMETQIDSHLIETESKISH